MHVERVRSAVAIAAVANIPLVIVTSSALIWHQKMNIGDLEVFLSMVFSPIIGLAGGAVGYYLGQRSGGG